MFFFIVSVLVGGLLIGALGRLVVPGPNPIGVWWTLLCGWGGSVLGGIVSRSLFGNPARHWLVTLVLEVLAAAALVVFVSRRRHGHLA